MRATRKALDLIEDEVGRPINFHSYVSGVAGPEMAVMFAEEGVNGAHQDPQYNVLYRNINMYRSFVDAAVAKHVMASVRMLQIDGAHNANATAVKAWKVMPELLVQHAINCAFSVAVGMPKEDICLSHGAAGRRAGALHAHGPALRGRPARLLRRVQDARPAEHALHGGRRPRRDRQPRHEPHDLAGSPAPTSSSTITPDEGRNVPWHYNNIAAVNTAKQSLVGMDGLREMVKLDRDERRSSSQQVREIKERAVLFLEAMLDDGGYFGAVEQAYFVDSGEYPETHDDGIAPHGDGGVAAGTIVARAADYLAPVCHHFGDNHLPEGYGEAAARRGRCAAAPSAAARCATPRRCRSSTSSTPRTTSTCGSRRRRSSARRASSSRRSSGPATAGSSVTMFLPAAPSASRSSRRSSSAGP